MARQLSLQQRTTVARRDGPEPALRPDLAIQHLAPAAELVTAGEKSLTDERLIGRRDALLVGTSP